MKMNILELANEIDKWTLMVNPKKVSEALREIYAENEALKAENQFFKDLMGDVEVLRKAQKK